MMHGTINIKYKKLFLDSITVIPRIANVTAIEGKFTYHWSTSALCKQDEFLSSG